MMSKSGCVECGSPVFFDEFDFVTTCSSCGTAFRLPRDNSGAWVLTYSSELNLNAVTERAVSIITSKFGVKRSGKDIELKEIYPVYLPIWNITAKSTGWAASAAGERKEVLPLHLEKQFRIPAYENTQNIGVPVEVNGTDVSISGDMTFPSLHVKLKSDELNRAVDELMTAEIDRIHYTRSPDDRIRTAITIKTLVMYPAWIVRFGTRNGEHAFTIDGISGQPLNDLGFRMTDTGLVGRSILAACCGVLSGTGVMMIATGAMHGVGFGLLTAGASLFVLVNILRHILRSQRFSPRPEGRRVTV